MLEPSQKGRSVRPRPSLSCPYSPECVEGHSLLKNTALGPMCILCDVFGRHETPDGRLRAVGEPPPAPVSSEVCSRKPGAA